MAEESDEVPDFPRDVDEHTYEDRGQRSEMRVRNKDKEVLADESVNCSSSFRS
jgi:hypothetical protein